MFQGKYIFSQIIDFIPRREFDQFVKFYKGNKRIRNLDCRDQLLAMIFGQLANTQSLRGIVLCLNAHSNLLYHTGFKTNKLILSTLARANEKRDFRIYQDLTQLLIERTRKLYLDDNDFKIEMEGAVYAIDSTIIEMCLSLFKWANFEKGHSAVKIHTQLDLRGNIPSFFLITEAKTHDVNFLDFIEFEVGAYYIMDRGYYDFKRLYQIHKQKSFFIIRAKRNISIIRMYSREINKSIGLRCDQTVKLKSFQSKKHYPEKLRRVKYYDKKTDKCYIYLTNNFNLDATVIANLYKHRWQIELFFKWMKQHLHINTFWGTSRNAVKTQICIAISAFLIVAIMKKQMNIERNLYEILQILSVSLFEKTPMNTLLSESNLQNLEDQTQKRLFPLDF